jgi:preprotein translocase subunit SecE
MNRQMKRMQERQERQQKASVADRRQAAASSARRASGPAARDKGKRVGARQFLKEVRQELNKVDWPTRKELGTYTVVVLATVIVLTSFVFVLDLGFSKAIVNILGS